MGCEVPLPTWQEAGSSPCCVMANLRSCKTPVSAPPRRPHHLWLTCDLMLNTATSVGFLFRPPSSSAMICVIILVDTFLALEPRPPNPSAPSGEASLRLLFYGAACSAPAMGNARPVAVPPGLPRCFPTEVLFSLRLRDPRPRAARVRLARRQSRDLCVPSAAAWQEAPPRRFRRLRFSPWPGHARRRRARPRCVLRPVAQ